jgi:hypothetical protein
MSTIRLSPGNVYQFGTVQNDNSYVAAINGTEIPIQKTFLNGIVLARGSSTGSIMYGSGSNFSDFGGTTLDNRGVFVNHGVEAVGQFHTLTGTTNTFSNSQQYASGSVYFVDTSVGDMTIEIPSNTLISGSILRFVKITSDSNRLTINPNGSTQINNATTQSSISSYATIELIATNNTTYDYRILSAYGTWT